MDVSECLLASMKLGIKSVSWAMVNELSADREYLADWISGGCTGPLEVLQDHIRLYWDKLRLVDMVPMLDNRTVVPIKLRDQVLETLH